jgi:hypothetical protein
MRNTGMSRDQTAARLGHGDEGELLDALCDRGDRPARVRRELDEVAPKACSPGARRGRRAAVHEAGDPPFG